MMRVVRTPFLPRVAPNALPQGMGVNGDLRDLQEQDSSRAGRSASGGGSSERRLALCAPTSVLQAENLSLCPCYTLCLAACRAPQALAACWQRSCNGRAKGGGAGARAAALQSIPR